MRLDILIVASFIMFGENKLIILTVASFIMLGENKVDYSDCGIFYHVWRK